MFTTKFAVIAATAVLTFGGIFAASVLQNPVEPNQNNSGPGFCVTAYNADQPEIISKRGNCTDDEKLPPVVEKTVSFNQLFYVTVKDVNLKKIEHHLTVVNTSTGEILVDETRVVGGAGFIQKNIADYRTVPLLKVPTKPGPYKVTLTINETAHEYLIDGDTFVNSSPEWWYGPTVQFSNGSFTVIPYGS